MARSPVKTLHHACSHLRWDNSIAPAMTIAPGETVRIECKDAAGGHFSASSTEADVRTLDPDKANPVTGPIYVDGAEPGDAISIRFEAFEPSGFGWTALIPGFGLLADEFPNPRLHLWSYDQNGSAPAAFGTSARVPLKPFAGTVGVAPGAPGALGVIPPRHIGGNLDIRDLGAGAELILPVETAGALLSIGDTHAAQGDGEVCGTAIESAMATVVRVDLLKGAAPPAPRFSTPGPVTRHLDAKGYEATTGVGPDLMTAARDAVRAMIDLVSGRWSLPPEDAYMLCSVCGDLRISEIVDAPNWVVSFYFPRVVFD